MSVIRNISLTQQDFHLSIAQMELDDRGVTALVGPSGSGKSTLIQILLGLQPLADWTWMLNGEEISGLEVERRNFGVVFQTLELFPHMSALENILFPLKCRGRLSPEILNHVNHLIDQLEIPGCVSRRPEKLSGGEKQRVALARALSFQPRFLFLDEPFSSLDMVTRKKSRRLVEKVLREHQVPALLISHDYADIEELSSKVHYIERGRLVPKLEATL